MGCLATAQVGGGIKVGIANALGLQPAARNIQAGLFLQERVPTASETAFPILWVEPTPKGQDL